MKNREFEINKITVEIQEVIKSRLQSEINANNAINALQKEADKGNEWAVWAQDSTWERWDEDDAGLSRYIAELNQKVKRLERELMRTIVPATLTQGERGVMKNKVFAVVHGCDSCNTLTAVPLNDGELVPTEGTCQYCGSTFDLAYEEE